MDDHNYIRFKNTVDQALKTVERILEVNRNPRLAGDVSHEYEDKYKLADITTNTTILAILNVLSFLGLTPEVLQGLDSFVGDDAKPATLRFHAQTSWKFDKEENVEVPVQEEREVEVVTETNDDGNENNNVSVARKKFAMIQNVREYHWRITTQWQVSVYEGNNVDGATVVFQRSVTVPLVTQQKDVEPLLPLERNFEHQVSLTWLLHQIDFEKMTTHFKIDRESSETKTPIRNKDIEGALRFMTELGEWMESVLRHFSFGTHMRISSLNNPVHRDVARDQLSNLLILVDGSEVFCPIQPLMMEPLSSSPAQSSAMDAEEDRNVAPEQVDAVVSLDETVDNKASPILPVRDVEKFLAEQKRTLKSKLEELASMFPPSTDDATLISVAEASVVLLTIHAHRGLVVSYRQVIGYIEKMLRDQIIAAIGKSIQYSDLDAFVKFHNQKLLMPPPVPFCHSIRRTNHVPEGVLAIEKQKGGIQSGGTKLNPIETLCRQVDDEQHLSVRLDAATVVKLSGNKFLHGWMRHCFADDTDSFQIVARARQFSCFMLVVGTMTGPNQMEPSDAIILQNKDEVLVPLLLETIPTATEFRDATKSLSPEQRRFAESFRKMQLESSVLGVCVVQIKPQLEKLLGLPEDGLTKEMKLTQDLMELFVKYQVPSDLVSYDGPDELGVKDKVENVRGHVQTVMDVIRDSRVKQLEEQAMKADMREERANSGATPSGSSFGFDFDDSEPLPCVEACSKSYSSSPRLRMASALSCRSMNNPVRRVAKKQMRKCGSSGPRGVPRNWVVPDGDRPKELMASEHVSEATSVPPTAGASLKPQKHDRLPNEDNPNLKIPAVSTSDQVDFTAMPKILDQSIERHGAANALRSTTIKTTNQWKRWRQENLLTDVELSLMWDDDIKSEKNKAFDLLDALGRSGSLPIECADLHVIVCLTHSFDNDVMDTVIKDNVNPIEKLESSTLLLGSTVLGVPPNSMIRGASNLSRLAKTYPALLEVNDPETENMEGVEEGSNEPNTESAFA